MASPVASPIISPILKGEQATRDAHEERKNGHARQNGFHREVLVATIGALGRRRKRGELRA
jgi:hypothetical protein